MERKFKITEEQYNRLCEWGDNNVSVNSNKPETIIQTTKAGLSNAASKALETNASAIEITDNSGNVNEGIITKNQLIAEARRDWKRGTKVVKLSELLKN